MSARRAALAARVLALREHGYLYREIADQLGLSFSYAYQLGTDPDGSKVRARKERYTGTCIDCGARTAYGNKQKTVLRCDACYRLHREPPHGTESRYKGRGCRCDACTAANTIHQRRLVGRTPPSHGYSGYLNYQCRCDVCKAANRRRYQQRKAAS